MYSDYYNQFRRLVQAAARRNELRKRVEAFSLLHVLPEPERKTTRWN